MKAPDDLDARFLELERLVRKGRTVSQAVSEIAPPPPSKVTLMRRAAAVRLFDDRRYRDVIAPGFEIPFEEFVNTIEIERTRPGSDLYRVVDPVAADCLEHWAEEDRAGLIRFLASVLSTLPEDALSPIERVRFLVAANAEAALKEFDRLFDEADKKFDLATCHALLQTLHELDNFSVGRRSVPLRLLSPELRARCDELSPYLVARGRFIEEYTKSANYLQRDTLFKQAAAIIDSTDQWLLPIYGSGGSGKTMFLRWLVARHCLPRPNSIPVARVDFDDINVSKVEKFPWLLLVPFAEQLNRQLAGAPFDEYLDRYVEYWPVLLPASRIPSGVRVEGLEAELEQRPREQDAVEEFAATIASHHVVLILDTLEEATLHFPESLRQVLRVFRAMRSVPGSSSGFKLILSGRYSLREKGFLEACDPKPVAIGAFTDEEAGAYLSTIRGLPPLLIPAIVAKARGNPFVLSLIADLVEDEGITDVGGISKLEPEFAYLIRRVILRIPDSQRAVRWVVRYGVVPQRLSRGFVQNVMARHLTRELEGDKEQYRDALRDHRDSFPRGGGSIDVDKLWTSLRNYADSTGWLRADQDELRFQPEVVRPMRALLAKEETLFAELHRDAAAWFTREAEREPQRRGSRLAEVFFHKLQLNDPGLEGWLHQQLANASVGVRHALLEAVSVLLPADQPVPAIVGRPLLSADFIASARLDLSLLLAGVTWGPCRVEDAGKTRRQLEAVSAVTDTRVRLVKLALAVHDRDFTKAAAIAGELEHAPPHWPEGDYAFHLLRARARIGLKQRSAEQDYEAASMLLRSGAGAQSEFSVADLWAEAGRELIAIGELAAGLDVLKRAVSGTPPVPIALDAAEACLGAHDYTTAASYAERAQATSHSGFTPTAAQVFRIGRVLGCCEVARGRLLHADARIKALRPPEGAPLCAAQMLELRGLFAGASYCPDEAVQRLQQAAQSYGTLGEQPSANRALLSCVRVLKEIKGDVIAARKLLERTGTPTAQLEIEEAHLDSIKEPPVTVDESYPLEYQFLARRSDPNMLSTLASHLETLWPATLRFDEVHFFRWLSSVPSSPAAENAIRDALGLPERVATEFFPGGLDAVEVMRAIGAHDARGLLAQAIYHMNADVFMYERLIDLAQRMNAPLPMRADVRDNIRRFPEGHGLPAATAIRYQSALFADRLDGEVIDFAPEELPTVLKGTQFEAMHCVNRARIVWRSDKATAEKLIREAADIFNLLGRERQARRLLANFKAGDLRAPKQDARRIVVPLKATDTPEPFSLGPEISFAEAKFLTGDTEGVMRALRAALPDECQTKAIVELNVDDAPGAALPWEWAMSQEQLCFRSARGLPDATRNELKRLLWLRLPHRLRRALSYLSPVRIAVIQLSVVHQHARGRGFERAATSSLSGIYRAHGLKVIEGGPPTPETLWNTFVRTPQVIHIQAPFSDRRGKLRIDLPMPGTDSASQGGVDAGVEFWAQQVRRAGLPAPLIILDPPRPPTDFEVGRQLLLRNRFAADLVATGTARAVLATGLFEPASAELATERMALEMSGNPALRRLLELLQQGVPGDQFSTAGAALFVSDPEALLK